MQIHPLPPSMSPTFTCNLKTVESLRCLNGDGDIVWWHLSLWVKWWRVPVLYCVMYRCCCRLLTWTSHSLAAGWLHNAVKRRWSARSDVSGFLLIGPLGKRQSVTVRQEKTQSMFEEVSLEHVLLVPDELYLFAFLGWFWFSPGRGGRSPGSWAWGWGGVGPGHGGRGCGCRGWRLRTHADSIPG